MAKEEKLRNEIEDIYKWDLTSLYKDENEYISDFNLLKDKVSKIIEYKNKITSSDKTLLEFLDIYIDIESIVTSLYVYANCLKDVDVTNQKNQIRVDEILNYYSYINEVLSFATPELLKTDYKIIKDYINKNEKLRDFEFYLENIYKYQPYTLNEKEEQLISNISDMQLKYEKNFELILYSYVDYGYIKDEEGNKVKLTNGNYSKYIKSKDRNVRKQAFKNRYKALSKYSSLFAVNYEAYIKADSSIMKSKGYKSSLDMYLFPDGLNEDIYDNLLKVSNDNINVLHKYFDMIKKVLGYKKLNIYDIRTELIPESNKTYSKEDAKKILTEALKILGEDYINIIGEAFDKKWIDFYPNKGKTAGYYQTDASKGNPLILANYNEDFDSVSSLAHELGHAVHSYLSNKNNKQQYKSYPILLAEIASLTNEVLLANYIINNSNDKEEKLMVINNILNIFSNNFFGTLSEGSIFEKKVHELVNNGEVIGEEKLNEIYNEISKKYYGPYINYDDNVKYNWCRVSHFYSPFYYYKYSVGICGACYVAKRILSGDEEFKQKYFEYLKSGGSKNPLETLKIIDIDLTKVDFIEEGISYFNELIDQFMLIYNS